MVLIFKLFNQQWGKNKQKTRRLWGEEFNIAKEGLDEKQVVAFTDNLIAQYEASLQLSADSLRSLIEMAVNDAKQIAASIKMKTQTDSETEAATIIGQAKQEAQEIKRRTEIAAQKEAGNILSVVNKKVESAEIEAKRKALLFLLKAREETKKELREEHNRIQARLASFLQTLMDKGQNATPELKGERTLLLESKDSELREHATASLRTSPTSVGVTPAEAKMEPETAIKEKMREPVQGQKEAPKEGIKQTVQLQEEGSVYKPLDRTTDDLQKQQFLGEGPTRQEHSVQLKDYSQTLYSEEVEIVMAVPVEPRLVPKLYKYLQAIPELKILHTKGSWDRGITITVVLDKPILLVGIMSKLPGIEVTPEIPQSDSITKEKSGLHLRAGGKGVKGNRLIVKEV